MEFYLGKVFQMLNYKVKNRKHFVVFNGHYLVALPKKIIVSCDNPHIRVSPCFTRVTMTWDSL